MVLINQEAHELLKDALIDYMSLYKSIKSERKSTNVRMNTLSFAMDVFV